MRRWALVVAIIGGCGGVRGAAPAAAVGRVQLVDAADATRYSRSHQHLELPFELDPAGTSGTALALDFLQTVQAYGAAYVSDLAIAIHFTHAGDPVECVSTIVVGAKPEVGAGSGAPPPAAASDDDIYSTTVRPWQPEVVTATVDDREPVCAKHGHQVIVDKPKYDSRFDVEVARYIEPGAMPIEHTTEVVWTEDCTLEPVHRTVQRYAHYVAARVAPIDLDRLGAFATAPLSESEPVCHKLAAGEKPRQRIIGDVHFMGGVGPASQLPDLVAH